MFGSSIETTCKREKLHGGGAVPLVLKRCLAFLDSQDRLKEAGIFRLPGNERLVSASCYNICIAGVQRYLLAEGGRGGVQTPIIFSHQVRQLKEEFQRGENPELDEADTYTVGSLMKLYLRNLPTSLSKLQYWKCSVT